MHHKEWHTHTVKGALHTVVTGSVPIWDTACQVPLNGVLTAGTTASSFT